MKRPAVLCVAIACLLCPRQLSQTSYFSHRRLSSPWLRCRGHSRRLRDHDGRLRSVVNRHQGRDQPGSHGNLRRLCLHRRWYAQLAVGSNMTFTGDGTEQLYNLPINFTLKSGKSYDIGIDSIALTSLTGRLTTTSLTPAATRRSMSALSRSPTVRRVTAAPATSMLPI